MKRIFLIGGLSESGKSTLGKHLDSQGVIRLKFVNYLKEVMQEEGAKGDFYEWNGQAEAERPNWLYSRFLEVFKKRTAEKSIQYCCVESLYNPKFGTFIKEGLGKDRVTIVYVDIPLETRLERQIAREGLSSRKEAERILLPRDAKKERWGVLNIKEIADEIVENSGTIQELREKGDKLIEKYCPELTN